MGVEGFKKIYRKGGWDKRRKEEKESGQQLKKFIHSQHKSKRRLFPQKGFG